MAIVRATVVLVPFVPLKAQPELFTVVVTAEVALVIAVAQWILVRRCGSDRSGQANAHH